MEGLSKALPYLRERGLAKIKHTRLGFGACKEDKHLWSTSELRWVTASYNILVGVSTLFEEDVHRTWVVVITMFSVSPQTKTKMTEQKTYFTVLTEARGCSVQPQVLTLHFHSSSPRK